MSLEKNYITEKIYVESDNQNNDNNSENIYRIKKTEKKIKTQTNKYKYVYSNINNQKTVTENSINNNINADNMYKRKILNSENMLNNDIPLNCETNYSINKLTNVRFVNGSNKNFSKLNYIRNPDIKFKSHEKSEKKRKKDEEEKCLCDKNILKIDGDVKVVKNYEKNSNILENNPVIFSNYDNYNMNMESRYNNVNSKEIKYSSPKNKNNRSIKERIYYNRTNYTCDNSLDDGRNIRYINNRYDMHNNTTTSDAKKYTSYRNSINNMNKNNYNFKSVSQCSYPNLKTNYFSPNKNDRTDLDKRYKYNIRIHNINVNKGMNRSVSYETLRNNRRYMSNLSSLDEYGQNYNLEYNNLRGSYQKNLKMQNAQNMQVIQDEKIYQILVPIPENKIDYACNMEIRSNNKKKYIMEEINKRKKISNIQTTEIIEDNKYKNKKILKKPNWNLTNKTIKENKISYEKNLEKIEKIPENKIPEVKKELNMENFEINIADNGRRFRGEMLIENNSVQYEKHKKNPNSNLLLSPSQSISLKADHPKRDWNNITKPTSIRPLSIEGKNKQVLLERSVEKLSIKGNSKPKNDWNICNNEKKEVNINLYQKKKRQILSKEKMQPFVIKGQENKWNITSRKQNETKLTIRGIEKKPQSEETEDDVIINDDYNSISENITRPVKANILKKGEITEESSSDYDILKNINKFNCDNSEYKNMIIDSYQNKQQPRVIINNISKRVPKKVETYYGKDEINEKNEIIVNNRKDYNENVYSKKKIVNTYSKKIIGSADPYPNITVNIESGPQDSNINQKYIYREVIKTELNDKLKLNNAENQENEIKNMEIHEKKNNYNERLSELLTPKSQTKYSYREEIISLSPSRSEKQNDFLINININRNSIKSINSIAQSSNNDNKNDIYQAKYLTYQERMEQQIPEILEEDSQMSNNYRFIQNATNKNQEQEEQPKLQYVYKIENPNKNTYGQNNINSFDNLNQSAKFQSQINNVQKEENKENNLDESHNKSNEVSANTEQMDELKNNHIYINQSQVVKSNDLNILTNNAEIQQQYEGLSKSQEMPLLAPASQNNNNDYYNNYIQNYSNFLNTNPVDNYNDFSFNKLNIVPMSAGRYGNIILNNVLSKSLKTDPKGIKNTGFSQMSNRTNNIINYKSVIINSRRSDINSTKNNKKNNKIKVLKD